MTRHPSQQDDIDWGRYEWELFRSSRNCDQLIGAALVVAAWLPIIALVWWVRR